MRMVIVVLLLLAACTICFADVGTEPTMENKELKARIEKLEKELSELKKIVMQQEQAKAPAKTAETTQKAEPEKKEKIAVVSGLEIQLYGRLKLDAAYDTSRMSVGNYARWVEPDATNKNDDEFNMTANETRLGMLIYGPKDAAIKTSGRVEIDFYEGGAENKPSVMMRHAYLNLDWPEDKFSILAGQTSDVISPLVPETLNYSVAWWAGNIGYRRPQIRLTKAYTLAKDVEFKFEGAIARTIGLSGDFTPGDAGEDAGIPGFQGRTSITLPLLDYKPTTIGFSGHWAKEEYDTDANGSNDKFDSWSLNLDVTQPVNEWLSFKGEFFTGENLSAYLGGIGQGVRNLGTTASPNYDKEIGSTGGWVAAHITPGNKWRFNLGFSVDDVDNEDLVGITGDKRELNRTVFGNAIYSVDKNAEIGFELSQWHTEYQGEGNADNLRAQTSFIYKF